MATLQGSSLGLKFPPSPSLFSHTVASRFKNEIFSVLASRSRVAYKYNMHRRPTSLCRSSQGSYGELHSFSQRDLQAVANKSVFLRGSDGLISGKMLPIISNKCRFSMCARAKKNKSFSLPFPEMKEKPEWWWRTLACIPYLISMQISDAGFYVNPLLRHKESFESLIFYIPGGAKRLPTWFPMLYIYLAYFGVVKNKEWPHFFRYHVVMAMLLETMVQVIWHSSNFMPLIHWNGTFGMYYWAAVGFAYICVILECIRCALGGNYVKIPFVSEAALIHTLFHVGGFYKPF